MVDVDIATYNINIAMAYRLVTPKTKAIVPVHLYGQSAAMDEVPVFAKKFNLLVVEDTAQALGGDYTRSNGTSAKTSTLGDIGYTSFFPSKNLGCFGDGDSRDCAVC
jgi:UDP-2-acetamido-2-deoxy-ribo-hexuluronate aminotransferase